MTTGARVKKLRKERKLTLREAADLMHMSFSNIAMIERGEHNLTADNAVLFADFYGVSVDYLLCQTDDRTPSNNILDNLQVEILNSTQDLTPEQKQDVLTYIDFLKAKGILKK